MFNRDEIYRTTTLILNRQKLSTDAILKEMERLYPSDSYPHIIIRKCADDKYILDPCVYPNYWIAKDQVDKAQPSSEPIIVMLSSEEQGKGFIPWTPELFSLDEE